MQTFISSLQHPLIKHLVKLRQNSRYRNMEKSLVIEGVKPILEICQHTPAKIILTTDPSLIGAQIKTEKVIVCTEAIMHKASGMISNEGILAEFPQPTYPDLEKKGTLLILDSINDPGNLGTLMRTALALNWDGIFLVGDCCDPYNEKALRAGRGANFKLPWFWKNWNDLKALAEKHHLLPLLADLNGALPQAVPLQQGLMLILSNEAHGPSDEATQWCKKVSIPLSNDVESLNVAIAGAILMHSLRPPTGA